MEYKLLKALWGSANSKFSWHGLCNDQRTYDNVNQSSCRRSTLHAHRQYACSVMAISTQPHVDVCKRRSALKSRGRFYFVLQSNKVGPTSSEVLKTPRIVADNVCSATFASWTPHLQLLGIQCLYLMRILSSSWTRLCLTQVHRWCSDLSANSTAVSL